MGLAKKNRLEDNVLNRPLLRTQMRAANIVCHSLICHLLCITIDTVAPRASKFGRAPTDPDSLWELIL
jgi:hypothetical protein